MTEGLIDDARFQIREGMCRSNLQQEKNIVYVGFVDLDLLIRPIGNQYLLCGC